jgi:FkbM family methyltransferase
MLSATSSVPSRDAGLQQGASRGRYAMEGFNRKISGFIPKKLRTAIRPVYRRIRSSFKRSGFDSPSTLRIGSFGGFDVAYRKGTADEQVISHSFDHDIYFSGVPEYKPAGDQVIIDVGAHIGTFSLLAASKVPQGKVFAIEACEDSFNYLRINAALNKSANISPHHLAMTDRKGTCRLYYNVGNWGHSVVKALSQHSETAEGCTLADFLERNDIRECHFMKLNCEGAEFPILLNSPSDVLQRLHMILVLYHCDLWGANTLGDLLSHFDLCHFSPVLRNQDGQRGWIIATNNSSLRFPAVISE